MSSSNLDKNQENYRTYLRWREGKTLEELVFYTSRRKAGSVKKHKIALSKINNELQMGSSFAQNGLIRADIAKIEVQMRQVGLLDQDERIDGREEKASDPSLSTVQPSVGGLSAADRKRLSELEEENAYLREELKVKDTALRRYGLIDRFMSDTMRLPR